MKLCIRPQLIKFLGLVCITLFILLLWFFKSSINNVLKIQLLYIFVPLMVGYLSRYVLDISKSDATNADFYLSSLNLSQVYNDFIYSFEAVFSLHLKKVSVYFFSILYSLLILLLIRLNGGFHEPTAQLLLSSIPLVLLFLSLLGNLRKKGVVYLLLLLECMLLGVFIYYQGLSFLLDFLLLTLSLYIISLSLIYPSDRFYKLGLLFITFVPLFLLLKKVPLSEFFANCAYFLLLVGTIKTLFYDLFLENSGVTYKHEDVF